jgi:hypothetical protein
MVFETKGHSITLLDTPGNVDETSHSQEHSSLLIDTPGYVDRTICGLTLGPWTLFSVILCIFFIVLFDARVFNPSPNFRLFCSTNISLHVSLCQSNTLLPIDLLEPYSSQFSLQVTLTLERTHTGTFSLPVRALVAT